MKTHYGILLVLFGVVSMISRVTGADGSHRSVEELTMALELEDGGDELRTVAAQRAFLLARLVDTDPGRALSVALPREAREALSPRVRDLVEERVELEGSLELPAEDRTSGRRRLSYLRTGPGRRYALHFARQPAGCRAGTRVRVSGLRIDSAIVVASVEAD